MSIFQKGKWCCKSCRKSFATAASLHLHERSIHKKIKSFTCDMCQRHFAQRATLENHIRTHTKERPFECEQCHKSFSHRATLANHRNSHLSVKPHKCDGCQKRFSRLSNMKRHLRKQHGIEAPPSPRRRRTKARKAATSTPVAVTTTFIRAKQEQTSEPARIATKVETTQPTPIPRPAVQEIAPTPRPGLLASPPRDYDYPPVRVSENDAAAMFAQSVFAAASRQLFATMYYSAVAAGMMPGIEPPQPTTTRPRQTPQQQQPEPRPARREHALDRLARAAYEVESRGSGLLRDHRGRESSPGTSANVAALQPQRQEVAPAAPFLSPHQLIQRMQQRLPPLGWPFPPMAPGVWPPAARQHPQAPQVGRAGNAREQTTSASPVGANPP